jgi:anti-sigma factor RsiW
MHLDEDRVERLLHSELDPQAEASCRAHLAGCPDCRRRLAEAEREEAETQALLHSLDHPLPEADVEEIVDRARVRESAAWGRWAAGFLIAAGIAGTAYAIPGSPLKAWVRTVAGWAGDRLDSSPTRSAPAPPLEPRVGGIAVAPGRALLVQFTSTQSEGNVLVTLTDGTEVIVRGPMGAATFTSAADRLLIDNPGSSATFEIQIPRSAAWVEIRVGAERALLKAGTSVSVGGTERGSDPYVLPLQPSNR